jgi:lysozyme family protein
MPPTPEQTELGYHRMWDRAKIEGSKIASAENIAGKIKAHRDAYEKIENATGVPWFMVGAIHSRESDLNFKTHLHNGDSLNARTRNVPAGRPKAGSPPFDFTESAIDALTMSPHQLQKVTIWSIERMLYELERYNGWGYLAKGNSPYLWSWTSEYHGGKYVRDGVYKADAWDTQAGCVALLKQLAATDTTVADRLNHREATPPKDVHDQATKKERATRAVSVAGVGGGGANEAVKTGTQQPDEPTASFMPPVLAWSLIGVGVAVMVVATVLIARKKSQLVKKWS